MAVGIIINKNFFPSILSMKSLGKILGGSQTCNRQNKPGGMNVHF
jgi:hypothetical protein